MPMIKYVSNGDIFASDADALVNAVNIVGVMGKGLALAFKKRFPGMYEEYHKKCKQKQLQIGIMDVYLNETPVIINFPTKKHWKDSSRLEYVEKGLEDFCAHYAEWGIKSVAFPQLGCGFGGLKWSEVQLIMEQYLAPLEIEAEIYVGLENLTF
jgi:O-acetyl-ADP-ribose deacetylase (regulator of RNase III)